MTNSSAHASAPAALSTRSSLISGHLADLRSGSMTAAGLLAHYLQRIRSVEPRLKAFASLDEDHARAIAEAQTDAGRQANTEMILDGIPVGIKDIIDVAGMPTGYGSTTFPPSVPEQTASVVEKLERCGAIPTGKTVSTEFAFAAPGPTRNPWDLTRTPGGSSMGSAAAVAAGLLPAAIGTQTNSSVIMPAALCGVVAFKPTYGLVALDGVLRFSPTLDQIGCFATSVTDAAILAEAIGVTADDRGSPSPAIRLAIVRTSDWDAASSAIRDQFNTDIERLRERGVELVEAQIPSGFDADARNIHRTIMAFEAARELAPFVGEHRPLLSAVLQRFIAEGEQVSNDDYARALQARLQSIDAFTSWADDFDALITPAAPDEAPLVGSGTGDPRFCTRWTLIGAPALVLPSGRGPNGLPLGLQFVTVPGRDAPLLNVVRDLETAFPQIAGTAQP